MLLVSGKNRNKNRYKIASVEKSKQPLSVAFTACNDPKGPGQSDEQRRIELAQLTDDVYYVVGYHAQSVTIQDDGTAKAGIYLLISGNLQDTVSVFNSVADGQFWDVGPLFDGIFNFPAEDMHPNTICGMALFPQDVRYTYEVKINSYRPLTEAEEIGTFVACNAMILVSPIRPNKYIVIESLSKVE